MNTKYFLLFLCSALCTIRYQRFSDQEPNLPQNPDIPLNEIQNPMFSIENEMVAISVPPEESLREDLPYEPVVIARASQSPQSPRKGHILAAKAISALVLAVLSIAAFVLAFNHGNITFAIGMFFGVLGLWFLFIGYALEIN